MILQIEFLIFIFVLVYHKNDCLNSSPLSNLKMKYFTLFVRI